MPKEGAYILTYDGSMSSSAVPELYVQTVRRPFVGGVRDVYVEVPGRESAWLFAEEPGDATITMECAIVGASNTARRAAVRNLAAWASKRGRKALIIDDEPDRLWWAKLASPPDVQEAINWGRFSLEWRCQPYAEAVAVSSAALTGLSTGVTKTFDVPGDGIARMYPVIEVTTVGTAASGIAMEVNGIAIATTENLGAGVTRTFSTLTATVTTGANADAEIAANTFVAGTLAMSGVTGDFGFLTAGTNTLKSTRGSFTARVVWRRRYS